MPVPYKHRSSRECKSFQALALRRKQNQQMADILRQNYVALIGTLREQQYMCDYLGMHNILTEEDKETILCKPTNASKNRLLIDYVRCRFKRAFPHFCDCLERTGQHDLLESLDPDRKIISAAGGDCIICLSLPARIAINPCGHMCTCQSCSLKIDKCPVCRGTIGQRLCVYV